MPQAWLPGHVLLVAQHAHQLGHRDGRVVSFRWIATLSARLASVPYSSRWRAQDVLHRGGDEEVPGAAAARGRPGVLSFGYSTQEMFSYSFFTPAARA